jgi:Protein of unknown function (DUF1549)/Protein of unknown function (DUF1553)
LTTQGFWARHVIGNRCKIALVGIVAVGLAAAAPPAELRVFPPQIHLRDMRSRQHVIVQAAYDDGTTRDVTGEAKYSLIDPAIARIEHGQILPVSDGSTELVVEFAGKQVHVPLTVTYASMDAPASFRLDVMPILMREGCNAGSCHGAARGKDGFRLSLFGFDPQGDYYRLTRELPGRRINLAIPSDSLILQKATGHVPHTGGARFDSSSQSYDVLRRWLEQGALPDPLTVATAKQLELFPREAALEGKGTTQTVVALARYSDGSQRDVTSQALFLSNNDSVASVSPAGQIRAGDRGEAFVMARFATFTVGFPVVVLPGRTETSPASTSAKVTPPPAGNYIDSLIDAKLKKLRITQSSLADDETFLRRVYIDVVGLLPTPAEYERFTSSQAPDKRERLVDELLARKEFVELWVLKWAELLQIHTSDKVSYKATILYYNWLQSQLANNVPVDAMVRQLLASKGGTFKEPATNYYQTETETLKVAENVAQVFMGMRIQCAQCHNHPFDRWTQDDYYGFAAFFAQIGRKPADDPRETIVSNSGGGEVNHPVGGRVMKPKFLGGDSPNCTGRDRREVLAQWLTSPDNPYFARNLSNMVWAQFFGRGIIEPVDDVRISNPASNPELLDELGKRFVDYHYDFKKLVRDICTSRTYQLASEINESNQEDLRNFSHAAVRRIKAETFNDCIDEVTETKQKFPGLPLGARAVQIADGGVGTYFLSTFGRATRETVCSCEVKLEPTLSQSLHLLNGESTTQKIQQGNLVGRRLAEKKSAGEIVDELYVRVLCRKPKAEEKSRLMAALKDQPDPNKSLEDVFWALLNSREFMFNH